eukprot:Tamp_25806.p1 GENE.Tamp_25806~~Tamp_25806.p1  ORF type:complete len:191 (+),score=31.41 Tamp_25806:1-573(+)
MATAALCGAGRHAARRLALAPGAGAVRATSLLPPLAARGPGGAGGARLLSSVPSAFIVPSLPRLAAARAVAEEEGRHELPRHERAPLISLASIRRDFIFVPSQEQPALIHELGTVEEGGKDLKVLDLTEMPVGLYAPALRDDVTMEAIKRTYQPHTRRRKMKHGFFHRLRENAKVLQKRRQKGRHRLTMV